VFPPKGGASHLREGPHPSPDRRNSIPAKALLSFRDVDGTLI
jgi:hypothetical protein